MKLGKAILQHNGDKFEVRVMAISEGYAMVRRKGAMPFVCNVKDLAPHREGEK